MGRLGWATGAILAAWWTLAVARAWQVGAAPSEVAPYLYAPLLVIAGGWLGRWAGSRMSPQAMTVVLGAVSAHVALAALLGGGPGSGTTGYANANAALAVQLIALGGLMALHHLPRRRGLAVAALGIVALSANSSKGGAAAGVIVLAVVALAIGARRARRRWPAVIVSLGAGVAAVAVLIWLARRPAWPEWALAALSSVRRDMWTSAWAAFRGAPIAGVGPGGYAQVNPWAHDPDTMSAHSLPLQVAAELGTVGLVLLTLMFLCGLAWASRAATPQATWIAVAAWTALAAHSFMDHLLEYWPIPLAAGLVLGYALIAQPDPEPPAADGYSRRGTSRS